MSDGTTPVNFEDLSDEQILNMEASELVGSISETTTVEQGNDGAQAEELTEAEKAAQAEPITEGEGEANGTEGTEGEEGQGGGDAAGAEGTEGDGTQSKAEEDKSKEGTEGKTAEGAVPPVGSKEGEAQIEGTQPSADGEAMSPEDFQKAVMAPFKANGKTFTPKSPKEVIQLMQMGANYTRKMMDIQPHRKVLTMLQNNDLLDEGKLDLLISVSKKDPEAIKKFLKDSGIDPLDIDTQSEAAYVEGSHLVTDNEVQFNSAVEDLLQAEAGAETLQMIRGKWDQASKDALWKEPSLIAAIHQQKQSGVYDFIADEVERQRTLGAIPADTPFIKAYQLVGDHLAKSGATIPGAQADPVEQPKPEAKPQPVATKAAVPKAKVDNGDKAGAAGSSRTSAKPAKVLVNPLSLPDDEFMNMSSLQGRI